MIWNQKYEKSADETSDAGCRHRLFRIATAFFVSHRFGGGRCGLIPPGAPRAASVVSAAFPSCYGCVPPPAEVARHGQGRIEGVQGRRPRNLLVEVQSDGHQVRGQPHEPLLDVFAREHPHRHDRERRGEAVPEGHGAVREAREQQVERPVRGEEHPGERRNPPQRRVADRRGLLRRAGGLRVPLPGVVPYDPSVESCEHVIDLHRAVGVKPRLVVERPVHDGHDETHDPQPDVGAVFEPEVEEAERDPRELQGEFPVHRFRVLCGPGPL